MLPNHTLHAVEGAPRYVLTSSTFDTPVPNNAERITLIPRVGGSRENDTIHEPNDNPEGYGQPNWIYEDPSSSYTQTGGGGATQPVHAQTNLTDDIPTRAETVDGAGDPDHNGPPIQVLGWVEYIDTGEGNLAERPQGTPPAPTDTHNEDVMRRTGKKKRSRAAMRIASLNMRGGGQKRSGPKWDYVNQIVRDGALSMLALQETHLTEERLEELQALYKRIKIFNSPDDEAPSRRGGIALVLNTSKVKWKNAECTTLQPGRAIQVKVEWGEDTYLVVAAIYAPSGDDDKNRQFWEELHEQWNSGEIERPDVMLGDLNMVECALDRMPARPDNEGVTTSFDLAMRECKLVDGWRMANPDKVEYTFATKHTGTPNSRSRIDRIYVREEWLDKCDEWHIEETGVRTDHKMVSVYLTTKDVPFVGKGRSTIPSLITDHKAFRDLLLVKGRALDEKLTTLGEYSERRTVGFNPQTVWKAFKRDIMTAAKEFLRNRATDLERKIEEWEKRRAAVLEVERGSPGNIENTSTLLDEIDENIRGLNAARLLRKRNAIATRFMAEGESGSGYDHARHQELRPRDTIIRLKKKPGPTIPGRCPLPPMYEKTTRGMVRIASDYHSEIQKDFSHNPSQQEWENETNKILEGLKPKLSEVEAASVGADVTPQEVRKAIKEIKNGKAAGLDGIPVEILKFMLTGHSDDETVNEDGTKERPKTKIHESLAKVLNDIVEHGVSEGTDFAEGWLCPIYKKNDRSDISNYRPITVLNTDYKVLTKILTERFATKAPKLVHPDQAGFIRGRSIFDQTELIRMVIDAGEKGNVKGAIVCLDQEKAYDKIRHDFLWKTLEKLGFPARTIRTIRTLYENAETSVILNGEIGRKFRIIRGVRQGDPLSCLLFDFAIESLAEMLRTSGLMGIKMDGVEHPIVSMLFADDTTVFLHERDNTSALFQALELWCRVSGAKFNIHKTIIIPIGEEEYRRDVRETRKLHPTQAIPVPANIHIAEEGQPTRILGAFYGYGVDPDEIWKPILKKAKLALDRWARSNPTIRGRAIGNNTIIGGYTQYLTRAQGLPEKALKEMIAMTDDFVNAKNGEEKRNRVGKDTLSSKVGEGGVNVLDLRTRREAIELAKAQCLLSPRDSPENPMPLWAKIGLRTIAHYATDPYRKIGTEFLLHPFLQTWRVNVNAKGMPENLKRMMKAAYKHNVAFVVNRPTQELRMSMPYWYHVGNKNPLVSKYQNKWGKCQRKTHGVKTVRDMLAHVKKSRNQWCHETEECECPNCEEDRLMGCDSPLKCRKDATLKLDNLRLEWDPRKWPEDEPNANENEEEVPEGYKIACKLGHEPTNDPTKLLRVFTDPEVPLEEYILPECKAPQIAALPPITGRTTRGRTRNAAAQQGQEPPRSQEVVIVYTDGSCTENGTRNARCGSGLWYEDADPRNKAIRIGLDERSNNVGELVAILVSIQTHTNAKQVRIATDSQYAMDALTIRAEDWADNGFVDTKNAEIVKALIGEIQSARAQILIMKVKGHSGDRGNEGADALANEGARKETADEIDLNKAGIIGAAGGKLKALTQALAYRALRLKIQEKMKERRTTERNIELTCATIEDITGVNHTPESLWQSLHRRKKLTLTQKYSAFAWRGVHGAQKVGEYWIQAKKEDWAPCDYCGVPIESMQHILFECGASGQEVIWGLARLAWASAEVEWPHTSLGVVLGAGLMEVKKEDGKKMRGKSRLLQILVSESAYLIWLIRNEWRIGREQDPTKLHTKQEIENRWWAAINKRRTIDWALTNKRAYGRKALARKDVNRTWDGVPIPEVRNSAVGTGVIVGMAQSRRPPGRNR